MAEKALRLALAARAWPRNRKGGGAPHSIETASALANRLRHGAAEQFVLIDLVVDAVEIRTSNDLTGVQERDALALRDVTIALAEEADFSARPRTFPRSR